MSDSIDGQTKDDPDLCMLPKEKIKKKCIVIIVGYKASRFGLDDDVAAITKTFTSLFDAEVILWIDCTKEEIRANCGKFTTERDKLRAVDFVTIFALAHGNSDGRILCGNTIDDAIGGVRKLLLCPLFKVEELDQKLKWLVVQSCRGVLNDYKPMKKDGYSGYYPDYNFISYCTGEGTVSYQEGVGGKIYIQALCGELQENAHELSLSQILINVSARVEAYGVESGFQNYSKSAFINNCDDYSFV